MMFDFFALVIVIGVTVLGALYVAALGVAWLFLALIGKLK